MTTAFRSGLLAVAVAALSAAAHADSNVTLYGDIDLYGNYMKSSSGTKIVSLEDGALLRSRWGLRGVEDLGDGYAAKFNLEGGFYSDTGAQATTSTLFDRQAWVGIAVPGVGEFRAGRQNTGIFTRGTAMDFTARTLGSVLNDFNVPARMSNDLSFISSRFSGVQVEGHVSLPETVGSNRQLVYQLDVDYVSDLYTVGYAGLRARAPKNATYRQDVAYDNIYGNVKLGDATIYAIYVHTNNIAASGSLPTSGTIVAPVGGLNAGTATCDGVACASEYYNTWQVSADYKLTPKLRVGGLWGQIKDTSGHHHGGNGGAVGAYYDLSKRTTFYAMLDTIRNESDASYLPMGSAKLSTNFTAASDVVGKNITGFQLGGVHRF